MVESQRFPQDFDGIVAVAPVAIAGFGVSPPQTPAEINRDPQGNAILTDRQLPLIYKAVLARCDLNDGVKDGLVDPRDCRFDPAVLACPADQADPRACLTAAQVAVALRFYARGAAPGSELNWINNGTAKPGPPQEFVQSRGDPALVDTLNSAGNPDLRAFNARRGKLILVHGATDLIVLLGPTVEYYELLTRVMGGAAATQSFARFFVVMGMGHCSGGDGAWGISYVKALEQWVEQGAAPERRS
jgi:feruloyl esterase